MKKLLLFIAIFYSLEIFACDCEVLNPVLEFYKSELVFKGTVEKKVYSQDSLTYTIRFKILKHYKHNDSKEEYLNFKLKSENQFSGKWTSCDWAVRENQNWLVYASKNKLGQLTFSGICSNSKSLDNIKLSIRQEDLLNDYNFFKLDDYIYFKESNFNNTKPITNNQYR